MCRILITGIAEPGRGDNAPGVAVARRLARRRQPPGVEVVDFGMCEVDLAFAAADGYDAVVLVHGASRERLSAPVSVTEAAPGAPPPEALRPPGVDPGAVLELVRALGGGRPRLLLVAADGPGAVGPAASEVEALACRLAAAVDGAAPDAPVRSSVSPREPYDGPPIA